MHTCVHVYVISVLSKGWNSSAPLYNPDSHSILAQNRLTFCTKYTKSNLIIYTVYPHCSTLYTTSGYITDDDAVLLQVGEITFFNLTTSNYSTSVYASGCIDRLLLAQRPDTSTHLLVSYRINHLVIHVHFIVPLSCIAYVIMIMPYTVYLHVYTYMYIQWKMDSVY